MQPLDDAAVRLDMFRKSTRESMNADAAVALRIAASGVVDGPSVDSLVRLSELARLSAPAWACGLRGNPDAEES